MAQLLDRMVRTPKQRRIEVDESLNEVRLFLPHFNHESVQAVVANLQAEEGGPFPVDVDDEKSDKPKIVFLTPLAPLINRSQTVETPVYDAASPACVNNSAPSQAAGPTMEEQPCEGVVANSGLPLAGPEQEALPEKSEKIMAGAPGWLKQEKFQGPFSRARIIEFVNQAGFANYRINRDKTATYLVCLGNLISLLLLADIEADAAEREFDNILNKRADYGTALESSGAYDELLKKELEVNFKSSVFKTMGLTLEKEEKISGLVTSLPDLYYRLREAEAKLGTFGVVNAYINKYKNERGINKCELDCLFFTAEEKNLIALEEFAKNALHSLQKLAQPGMGKADPQARQEYAMVIGSPDLVSEINLFLPEDNIELSENGGELHANHLYVDASGNARKNLNSWERKVVEVESRNPDVLCWLRNFERKPCALRMPYELGGKTLPFYPDFLVFRCEGNSLVKDVIEPHRKGEDDSLAKVQALARYASKEPFPGRALFIREKPGSRQLHSIDLTNKEVHERVLALLDNAALEDVFTAFTSLINRFYSYRLLQN